MNASGKAKTIVITGCDSGIGSELCHQYLERGYTVIAGYFGSAPDPVSARHRPFPLDLRSEKSVEEFAGSVKSLLSGNAALVAVIQNAGAVAAAPIEDMPLDAVREIFEVNFFGAYSLTQKLIPLIIRDRSRIALVGSLAGRIALPFFSPYVASKFAIEGFADSLRREMRPFGVRTVLFEPAAVATPIWNTSWERVRRDFLPRISARYRAVFEATGSAFVAGGNRGMPTEEASRRMIRVLSRKRPRARYILSKSSFLTAFELLLPSSLMDRLIALAFGTSKLGKADSVAEERAP